MNISEAEFHKAYTPDHPLRSDARLAVAALHEALERKVGEVPAAEVAARDPEARPLVHLDGKIHPGELAQAIGRLLPPKAVLLADAGAHLAWLGYYVELEEGQNFRKAGSFGPMAGHVNGAIGVKLAHPERTVVVGCGDGCYALFRNPDFAAYARACGADGYRVETIEAFETAFRAALDSGRPTLIDARITRWAVPHYSPSPDGVIAALVETAEARPRD
ncbi:thiamine pyrophosphate-dependent enzyme [Streptomyces sp. NPDC006670]|uniref:thiamine pyrophosphate-dependent enzyme n=1 Tax=Streptomyces sp. NPDC006670 TaxID=3154476 RepID=UPI0033DF4A5D